MGFGDLYFAGGYFAGYGGTTTPPPEPSLLPWQLQYNGLTLGNGTAYNLQKIEGLDLPTVRTGDAGRPRDPGMFQGLDVLAGRDGLVLTGQMQADQVSFADSWSLLATATLPGGPEQPLEINIPGFGTLATNVRVRKRQMPIDVQFVLGGLADFVIGFAATDPRLYSTPTLTPIVGLPSPSAGFSFPLGFPLVFGNSSVAGVITAVNAGNIEMRPILTITGPCMFPAVTNASLPGNPTLQFNLTLQAGDELVIDTDLKTAVLFTAGSSTGSTRLFTLQPGSTWWTLQPNPDVAGGVNTIQFITKDSAPVDATLEMAYASAWVL